MILIYIVESLAIVCYLYLSTFFKCSCNDQITLRIIMYFIVDNYSHYTHSNIRCIFVAQSKINNRIQLLLNRRLFGL